MRSFIVLLVFIAFSISHAWAGQALDQLLACRTTPDSAARLECYDRASDAALIAKRPDDAQPPSKPPSVESSLVRIARPLTEPVSFTLKHGQVWRQMDSDDAGSAKIGDRVIVSKKFFAGAYWLRVVGGRAWRVTLVR